MTNIYLVRHGQASFGEDDYDKLSEKGIQQAIFLGKHWQQLSKNKVKKNAPKLNEKFYAGSLLRHEQTAEYFFNGLENNKPISITTHAGFNELDHVDVLTQCNPQWRSFQAMSTDIEKHAGKSKKELNQLFKQAFTQAMKRWVSGDFDSEYQETWFEFKQRCIDSLQDVINQQHTKNDNEKLQDIVIFTSGGVIGVIVAQILNIENQEALTISQQLVNSGVTKLVSTKQGLRVNCLNNYSHLELEGYEWISYF